MRWNYGIVCTPDGDDSLYSVHEIYHEDNDEKGRSWTETPVTFEASNIPELEEMLRSALKDISLARLSSHHHRTFVDLREPT